MRNDQSPALAVAFREQVGGPLLNSLSVEYNKHAFERLGEYKYDYGLAEAPNGSTVHHTSLIKFLAIVCCIAVLLKVAE